ncbi:MAG: hypothetical protein GY868_01970 [Deltaproteobacteria bacterium]|nr:hypothetical protein [Deltaproteobacteria bacterium]
MSFWEYPKYVSVAEKKAKAARKLEKLKKKNPGIAPVLIEGRALATTWWGKSWNANLERYADYSNRIGRGRSYVRHGAVLDLQVAAGQVQARVLGSSSRAYTVAINIQKMNTSTWKEITQACQGRLDSLQELLAGKFPKALGDLFMTKGTGMFPSPKEIAFSCSCPDWASMCKHVAAALYGIGARLDEDPNLFFKLRSVDVDDLVSQAIQDTTRNILEKSRRKSTRVLEDANLSDMFEIDLDDGFDAGPAPKKPSKRKAAAGPDTKKAPAAKNKQRPKAIAKSSVAKKSVKLKKANSVQKKSFRSVSGAKTARNAAAMSSTEIVFNVINKSRSKKGVSTATLITKTGLEGKKIWSAIAALKKQSRVKSANRGYYIKA